MSFCGALLGSLVEPLKGTCLVFVHAIARGVHHPKIELRRSIVLFSGLAEPPDGLGRVFCDAFTTGIRHAKMPLRDNVASFRGLSKPHGSLRVVLWYSFTDGILQAHHAEPDDGLRFVSWRDLISSRHRSLGSYCAAFRRLDPVPRAPVEVSLSLSSCMGQRGHCEIAALLPVALVTKKLDVSKCVTAAYN